MNFDFTPRGMFSAKHLRFRRVWFGIGLLMVLAVAVASIMSIPAPLKSVMLHDKLAHATAYGLLMGWFTQIFRHDLTRILLAIALVLMGIGIEYLQGMTTIRQFDILDMIANASGVMLAWALAYTRVGKVLIWVEGLFRRRVLDV